MGRQRLTQQMIGAMLVTFFVLVGCAPTATLTPVPPTPKPLPPVRMGTLTPALSTATSVSAGDYDGKWEGIGTTTQGRQVRFVFTVRNSTITSILWGHTGLDGKMCVNMVYAPIQGLPLPTIVQDKFSMTLGSDLSMTGVFNSSTTASGNMTIHWDSPGTCQGNFVATWTATKE